MGIEKRWKNWPYWMKGGIILQLFLIIQIILIFLVGLYEAFRPCGETMCGIRLMTMIFLPNLMMTKYLGIFVNNNIFAITLLMIIFSMGIYFLIGTAIGWAVGKIKKKRR